MDVAGVLGWLHDLSLSETIRTNDVLFPAIESVHVIASALVVGTVAIVDLRLLGLTSNQKPVSELSKEVLPWTWLAFVLAVISGTLMFIAKGPVYFANTPFRLKMLFMVLAGLNMLAFEFITFRSVHLWDRDLPTLNAAKVAGVLSLVFWIMVTAFARWIGFTIQG